MNRVLMILVALIALTLSTTVFAIDCPDVDTENSEVQPVRCDPNTTTCPGDSQGTQPKGTGVGGGAPTKSTQKQKKAPPTAD